MSTATMVEPTGVPDRIESRMPSAAQQTEKTLAEAHAACERMQKAARERLPRAAQWIAEEVVKSEWLS